MHFAAKLHGREPPEDTGDSTETVVSHYFILGAFLATHVQKGCLAADKSGRGSTDYFSTLPLRQVYSIGTGPAANNGVRGSLRGGSNYATTG